MLLLDLTYEEDVKAETDMNVVCAGDDRSWRHDPAGELNQNGTAARLTIPGAATAGTVNPLGTYGDEFPLQIGGRCDTKFAYSMIDGYNPSANTAKWVPKASAGDLARDWLMLFHAQAAA